MITGRDQESEKRKQNGETAFHLGVSLPLKAIVLALILDKSQSCKNTVSSAAVSIENGECLLYS